jgi:recombination protein RecT
MPRKKNDSKAIAKSEPQPMATVRGALARMEQEFAKVLPKHITPTKLVRVAITAIQKTPKLLDCSRVSLYGSIMSAAQLGLLTDGVTGEAYLVPFGGHVQLIPGYRGYIKLAKQVGDVLDLQMDVVRENDDFDFIRGSKPDLTHRWAKGNRGEVIYAYALIRYKSGGLEFAVMTKDDVEKRRKAAPSKNSPAWKNWWDEMAKKTAMRQLAKLIPLSSERLHAAVAMEDAFEGGRHSYMKDGRVIEVEPEAAQPAEATGAPVDALDAFAEEEPDREPGEDDDEDLNPGDVH